MRIKKLKNQISIFDLKVYDYIILNNNKHYFDFRFYHDIISKRWKEDKHGYAMTTHNGKFTSMHKFLYILQGYKLKGNKFEIHHKDGNKKNNKTKNLQLISNSDHAKTKRINNKKSSKYFYVTKELSGRYRATISWRCKITKREITKSIYSGYNELEVAKKADEFIMNNQNLFISYKRTNKELGLYS